MKTKLGSAKFLTTWLIGIVAIVAVFASACMHSRTESTVGSHKVKVTRAGFTNRLGVESSERGQIFRYDGFDHLGRRLQVAIENDRVSTNGQAKGLLRSGDAVLISDDGVAVNSMDYGQSAKYLEANAREAEALGALQKSGT